MFLCFFEMYPYLSAVKASSADFDLIGKRRLPRFKRRVYEVPPRIRNGDGVSGAIGVGDAFVNKQGGKSEKREGTKEGRETKGQSHMTRFF